MFLTCCYTTKTQRPGGGHQPPLVSGWGMKERTNSFIHSFIHSFITVLHSHHIRKVFLLQSLKLFIVSPSSQAPFVYTSHNLRLHYPKQYILREDIFWQNKKQNCQINLLTFSKTLPGRFKQENRGILKTVKTCNQTHLELSSLQLNIPWSRKGKSTTKSLRCFKNRITYK